jgi:hypothetical protein
VDGRHRSPSGSRPLRGRGVERLRQSVRRPGRHRSGPGDRQSGPGPAGALAARHGHARRYGWWVR